jgi:ABC-type spermidine/putrescine transport system permease subunit II
MWDDIYLKVNPTLSAVSTLLLVGVVVLLVVIEGLRRRLEEVATRH